MGWHTALESLTLRQAIMHALVALKGNMSVAARRLGLGRATLYRKMAQYGLSPPGQTRVRQLSGRRSARIGADSATSPEEAPLLPRSRFFSTLIRTALAPGAAADEPSKPPVDCPGGAPFDFTTGSGSKSSASSASTLS